MRFNHQTGNVRAVEGLRIFGQKRAGKMIVAHENIFALNEV